MSIINATLTLKDLPPPPPDKTGWPWSEQSQPLPDRMSDGSQWPRISIVTPSYNQGQFLEETIRSVLLQSYPNLSYIIIDGGSSDNSVEIIEKYQKGLSYWVSEPDRGPADAINKGWNLASGEIVAYLNSDDAYLPGTLLAIATAFHEQPEALAICGHELTIDSEGFALRKSYVEKIDHYSLLNLNFIPQPATFIGKSTLNFVGLMNLEIKYTFDFELWLRITRLAPINSLSKILAVTRWHEETITLTQRPKIGSELVKAIANEVKNHASDLSPIEKRQILFNVHCLAIDLNLEKHRLLQSILYAIKAFVVSPGSGFRFKLLQKYFRYFKRQIKSLWRKPKLAADRSQPGPHWSSFNDDSANLT